MVKKAAEATPNQLLRAARMECNWTQKEVADGIGAPHSFNVSRWEQGTAFPSAHYIRQLCLLFGKSARDLGLARSDLETSSPPPSTQSSQEQPAISLISTSEAREPADQERPAV